MKFSVAQRHVVFVGESDDHPYGIGRRQRLLKEVRDKGRTDFPSGKPIVIAERFGDVGNWRGQRPEVSADRGRVR